MVVHCALVVQVVYHALVIHCTIDGIVWAYYIIYGCTFLLHDKYIIPYIVHCTIHRTLYHTSYIIPSLGARPSKNQKGGSGTSAGVEVYTAEC